MSTIDSESENISKFKRKAESEDDLSELESVRKKRVVEIVDETSSDDEDLDQQLISKKRELFVEAMKKIDKIQYELHQLTSNPVEDFSDDSGSDVEDFNDESDLEEPEDALGSAEALGFAMCARETFQFLESQGMSPNDPIYIELKAKLLGSNE